MPYPAALIELDNSHDECLYSQLLFLKAGGYEVLLICSDRLRPQVAPYSALAETLFLPTTEGNEWQKLKILWRIRGELIRRAIRLVVFNSAHGRHVRNLLWFPYPAEMRFFGTLHGINKLRRSATQAAISWRMNGYFLLNDYLNSNLAHVPHRGLRFAVFYPIFFPQYAAPQAIHKPKDAFWIAVPGQVEQIRRDYERLIRAFAQLSFKPPCRFLLLGRSGHTAGSGDPLKALCASLGVSDYFQFWDTFLENSEFHEYLRLSDIVMPLIHPGNEGYRKYLRYQITGGYNLAFAYRKPLLMLEDFKQYADFQENAVFYALDTLADTLAHLEQRTRALQPQLYQHEKWTFAAQSQRYLALFNASTPPGRP